MKKNFKKLSAFTLSEVLITLGVIGVVAAMTLPVLIQKQQKMVWVNQLKKTYSTLEQGFQKMMADEGVDNLLDTSIFGVLNEADCAMFSLGQFNSGKCKPLADGLKRYFKGDYGKFGHDVYYLHNKSNYDEYIYNGTLNLADGSQVYSNFRYDSRNTTQCNSIKAAGGRMCNFVSDLLFIDINGNKGPNQYGRDVFQFYLSDNGKLYPYGGKDDYLYRNNGNISGYDPKAACNNSNNPGSKCAGYLIENGWKMDY